MKKPAKLDDRRTITHLFANRELTAYRGGLNQNFIREAGPAFSDLPRMEINHAHFRGESICPTLSAVVEVGARGIQYRLFALEG